MRQLEIMEEIMDETRTSEMDLNRGLMSARLHTHRTLLAYDQSFR